MKRLLAASAVLGTLALSLPALAQTNSSANETTGTSSSVMTSAQSSSVTSTPTSLGGTSTSVRGTTDEGTTPTRLPNTGGGWAASR